MSRRRSSSRCSRRLMPGSSARWLTADRARSRRSSMIHYGLRALWLEAGMVFVPFGGEGLGVRGVGVEGRGFEQFRRSDRHIGPVGADGLAGGGWQDYRLDEMF